MLVANFGAKHGGEWAPSRRNLGSLFVCPKQKVASHVMTVASTISSMTVGMFSLAGSRLSHGAHSRTISLSALRLAAFEGGPYGQALAGNDRVMSLMRRSSCVWASIES
jgi:hypothetical protein